MADGSDCVSETASSACDEERIKKLFQACDTNGDGFIDSHDLFSICKDLNLEGSIGELMEQLGADAQGRISYEQFLRSRLALRPEIDAIKHSKQDVASDNSQGKLDQWEWDSGARDMSPIPKSLVQKTAGLYTEEDLKMQINKKMDEQAQRYEERLTELHSVIAELTKKLHQQRVMAIAEEDEVSENCASAFDDSATCALEISELDQPQNGNGSDSDNKTHTPEISGENSFSKSSITNEKEPESFSNVVESLRSEIANLKVQLVDAQTKIEGLERQEREKNKEEVLKTITKRLLEADPKLYPEEVADIKYGNVASTTPVSKVAERVKLRRATDLRREICPNDLANSELPTAIVEHIVGDILCQCDPGNEKHSNMIEIKRIVSKLEHVKSQNLLLELTLNETKATCDRLALLCGKYESNAVALRLALAVADRTIEAYDVLLALLETEIGLNDNIPETFENRMAAESIATQLLKFLDDFKSTEALFSSWQRHRFQSQSPNDSEEQWTSDHENRLREHVSRLKAERSNIQGTFVSLESPHLEGVRTQLPSAHEYREMDLEIAVLMQELMSLREDKAELIAKLYALDQEKNSIELKLKYVEKQLKIQSVFLKNVQGQMREALITTSSHPYEERGYSVAEHTEIVEMELMQALVRESKLKSRLQEVAGILEQFTKNIESNIVIENKETHQDISRTSSAPHLETSDRNLRWYQTRLKKMEQQLVLMTEQHNLQIKALQLRTTELETPPTYSSENSVNSLAT